MNDIISKLLSKWFEWKLKSVNSKIKKLSIEKQKELVEEIYNGIEDEIKDLLEHILITLKYKWDSILDDIEYAQQEEEDNETETEVWSSDEKQ